MSRPGPNQTVFWACSAAVVVALGWLTTGAIRLERQDAESRASSSRMEATRLALWRMDSAMTPVIAREAARPFFHYQSFYPTDRAYTRMLEEVSPGEVLVPSPLVDAPVGIIRLYFEAHPSGEVTSPQVPRGDHARLAVAQGHSPTNIVAAQDQLARFETLRNAGRIADNAGTLDAPDVAGRMILRPPASGAPSPGETHDSLTRDFDMRHERMSLAATSGQKPEFAGAGTGASHQPPLENNEDALGDKPTSSEALSLRENDRGEKLGKTATETLSSTDTGHAPIVTTELAPAWIGPDGSAQLIFTRRVRLGEEEFEQGFWLDWELTRSWLLSGIGDLFPWADLRPVRGDIRSRAPEELGRTLASIPAEIVVGGPAVTPAIGWTPLRAGLVVAWVAVLASLAVTWRVLLALEDLAERRGRFAAAVSHELRTPLTTFSLYSQMLDEGMVPPERQREYIQTMRAESGRLARIVESVLDYARLGRAAVPSRTRRHELRLLLEPIVASLSERARSRGFEIRADLSGVGDAAVVADAAGVERILGNLVDNSCAYARDHEPRTIDLVATVGRREAEITVGDHGPGLSAEEARRAFEPYFRGRRTTDLGVPGIGLGLALARGVARGMGGDLRFEPGGHAMGASFTLRIPLAAGHSPGM